MADEGYGRQVPFAFLEKVREEFQQKFADKGRTSPAHSLDKQFGSASLAVHSLMQEGPMQQGMFKLAAVHTGHA